MTDQSIFNDSIPAPQGSQAQSTDAFATMLSAIKNENGQQKYASVEKALEALAHAQGYIPELKTEVQVRDEIINNLKAELGQKSSIEELVSKLSQAQAPQQAAQPAPANQVGLDQNSVADLVNKVIDNRTQTERFQANVNKTQEILVSKFGEKTKEVIAEKARELGLSTQEIGKLAGQSPQAVFAMFGLAGQNPAPSVTTGSVTLPGYKQPEAPELERPKKSLLRGATSKDQAAYMREIRENVYRKHGIEIKN